MSHRFGYRLVRLSGEVSFGKTPNTTFPLVVTEVTFMEAKCLYMSANVCVDVYVNVCV